MITGFIRHIIHVIYEVGYHMLSFLSRLLNTVFFRGEMSRTLSARTYTEASLGKPFWVRMEKIIDALFFWEENHCRRIWTGEVDRATETISKNKGLLRFQQKLEEESKENVEANES